MKLQISIGVFTLAYIVLLVLKLTLAPTWLQWWMVFTPLVLPLALFVLAFVWVTLLLFLPDACNWMLEKTFKIKKK
jgi:hypothetical protein